MTHMNLRLPVLFLFAQFLLSCDDSSHTTHSVPDADSQGPMFVYDRATYTVRDGILVLDYGNVPADTGRFCGTTRVSDGVWRSDLHEVPYLSIQKESLLVVQAGNDLVTYPPGDTISGRYVVSRIFRRIGAGSGLAGQWREVEHRVRDSTVWKNYNQIELSQIVDSRIEFTETTYRRVDRPLLSWADATILRWSQRTTNESVPAEGPRYDIEVTRIDPEAVRFRGRRTGEEVVRRRIRAGTRFVYSGDLQFSSSDASHPTFLVEEFPVSCPDDISWYEAFLEGNLKLPPAVPDSSAPDSMLRLIAPRHP